MAVENFLAPCSLLILTHVVKEAATEIAPYLCFIFQQSVNTGEVPAQC